MKHDKKLGLFQGMLSGLLIEGAILAIIIILTKIFEYIFMK